MVQWFGECHNGVLGNTMRKMMSDKQNYSLEPDVVWAIAAKNTLKNVYGFFLNQLLFGKNTATSLILSLKNYQIWKESDVVK